MTFPQLVYRCPGTHQCPNGTFDYLQVQNTQQLKDAVEAGWFPSLPEAVAGELSTEVEVPKAEVVVETTEDETSPPTREELEAKAKELGIGFNKNTKDETLLEKIEAALEE